MRYLTFCTSGDFWWLPAGFHQLSMSDLISSHQCNLTITVTSSWSQYLRSYEAKHCYNLPIPTNAQFQHDSCVGLKELPSMLVSHAYLIFRNKQDISHFAPLVTFGDFQQGFTNFFCLTWSAVISVTQLWQSCHPEVNTSEVMKQNVAMIFPALQMQQSNMTVVLGLKSYPQSWCHMPTLFWEISDISPFCTSDDFWWLLAGFHQFSLSDLISGHQCNSAITVMSSWSWYIKSYEAKHCYKLPSPTSAQVQHDSCVRFKELPSKLVSHAYLILRTKWDISHFAPLVTFDDFQQGFTNFFCLTWSAVFSVTQLWQWCHHEVDTSAVMKQNIAMSFPGLQMHNSNMTVMSGSKRYPKSWGHMPTLFSEISKISHILHLWWLLVTSSRVSPTFSVWHDQQSSV